MTHMKLSEFLANPNYHEWEDKEFMVERNHNAHGEPILSVTNFAHPEAGAKVYRNRDDVSTRLGDERVGEAS